MNPRAMTKRYSNPLARSLLPVSCLALALLVSACGPQGPAQTGEPPLAGASIGGPFTLVDSEENNVSWADFDGKYRIVYFGYAYCPDVCPIDVQAMMQGYNKFKQDEPELAAQIQPIFITIDPARDTPAVVGEFTSAFSDDLLGLTGTAEQIEQAAKAFAVYYAKGETSEAGGYLMDHSRGAYLMGRAGEPIALLPVDGGADAVAAELARWTS